VGSLNCKTARRLFKTNGSVIIDNRNKRRNLANAPLTSGFKGWREVGAAHLFESAD
jgi:hypothetical protein